MESKRTMRGMHEECSQPCCVGRSPAFWFLKIFLTLAILFCAFAIGVAAGVRLAVRRAAVSPFGMMTVPAGGGNFGYRMMGGFGGQWGTGPLMMRGFDGMQGVGEWDSASGTALWFGSITKIDGNKITIEDNGANQQVVLSQASTIIWSPSGEVSLLSLKIGQTIAAAGSVDQDNQLEAKLIRAY